MGILLTIIIFAVLRYNTGWDYVNYIETVNTPSEWNNPRTTRYTLFWVELFRLSRKLNFPHFVIAIANILTYIILYKSLYLLKLKKSNICDALLVYALWNSFYLASFSTIRQSLAVSIGLLMFAYIQRKEYVKSIIVLAIAIHIHASAGVLIMLYPVFYFRNKLTSSTITFVTILMVVGMMVITKIIASISILQVYLVYLGWSDKFGGKMILVDIVMLCFLLLSIKRRRNLTVLEFQCYFLAIISFIGRIIIFVLGMSSVLSRLMDYFLIFLIIVLFPSLRIFRDPKEIRAISVALMIMYFIVYLQISEGGTKLASTGYVPYKFIIFN